VGSEISGLRFSTGRSDVPQSTGTAAHLDKLADAQNGGVIRMHSEMENRPAARSMLPRWFTVKEVAQMLGYGETKVRLLIISGDLRSLKDGRSRRVLPEWLDEYVERRVAESEEQGR